MALLILSRGWDAGTALWLAWGISSQNYERSYGFEREIEILCGMASEVNLAEVIPDREQRPCRKSPLQYQSTTFVRSDEGGHT
jgi:hypothetical protein